MKKLLNVFVGGVITTTLIFSPSKANSMEQLEQYFRNLYFMCQLLNSTIKECENSAKKKNIMKKPDECDTLGLAMMGATIFTLSKAQGKPVSEDLIKVGQVVGKVCYKACMKDEEFIKKTLKSCEGTEDLFKK